MDPEQRAFYEGKHLEKKESSDEDLFGRKADDKKKKEKEKKKDEAGGDDDEEEGEEEEEEDLVNNPTNFDAFKNPKTPYDVVFGKKMGPLIAER